MHPSPPAKAWHIPRPTPLSRTAAAAGGTDPSVTENGHFLVIAPSATLATTDPHS
jgi:hypothetical protein